MSDNAVEILKFYRGEIRFQSNLLSGRLNAFISSQSFLLIAYASAASSLIGQWEQPFALLFPTVVALLGFVLALQARPGIKVAYEVVEEWQQRQTELLIGSPELGRYDLHADTRESDRQSSTAVDKRHSQQGAIFARHAPRIFAVAWCYFGLLPLALKMTL